MRKINKKIIYICVIILIVMSYIRGKKIETPYLSTLAFMVNFITYTIMLLIWIISIYNRIMHKNIKRYLISMGIFMLMWLFFRTSRHRIFMNMPQIQIFLWYCYYIPILSMALISYYVSLSIGYKEDYKLHTKYKLLIIPTLIFMIFVLTNNIHQYVFILPEVSVFPGKQHGYNIMYYIILVWVLGLLFNTMYVIFKKCRIKEKKNRIVQPFIIITFGILYTFFYNLNQIHIILNFMEITVVYSLIMIAFWESCIHSGLIPSNSKYNDFFKSSVLNSLIVDDYGITHYYSNKGQDIDIDEFEELKKYKKIKINKDTMLCLHKINGGYIVWREETSSIDSLIEQLENVNLELEDDVVLMTRQIQTEAKLIRYAEKIRLYDIIKEHTNPQLMQIKENLEKTKKNKYDIKLWRQINILATYIKRCINLILISQSEEKESSNDFEIAIKETIERLKQSGVDATINNKLCQKIKIEEALKLYYIIQYIIELTFPILNQLFITLDKKDDKYIIHAIIGGGDIKRYIKEDMTLPVKNYKIEYDENLVNIRIVLEKEVLNEIYTAGALDKINDTGIVYNKYDG